MGIEIDNIKNGQLYKLACIVDGNKEKLKEAGYDDEEISELIRGKSSNGNANGIIDDEELDYFKEKAEVLISEKDVELAQETNYAKETKTFYSQIGLLVGGVVGLLGALATKGKIYTIFGLLGGAATGLAGGLLWGTKKANDIITTKPEVANLHEEVQSLKEDYRKIEPNYIW